MIKCEACRAFTLFLNEINRFNNTGARMLDSYYQRTFKLFCNRVFVQKRQDFAKYTRRLCGRLITLPKCKPLILTIYLNKF